MRVPKFLLPPPKNWIWGPKTAKFGPKQAFLAKYEHFWPILLTPLKIRIFGPKTAKNQQIWPETGIFGNFGPGLADSFGAMLVGCLVVVGGGLYLVRHLFTLFLHFASYKLALFLHPTKCILHTPQRAAP